MGEKFDIDWEPSAQSCLHWNSNTVADNSDVNKINGDDWRLKAYSD